MPRCRSSKRSNRSQQQQLQPSQHPLEGLPPPLESPTSAPLRQPHPAHQHRRIKRIKTEIKTEPGIKADPQRRPSPSCSTRYQCADLSRLHTYLGRHIPIVNGGQVKGGVVAVLSSLLPPHPSQLPATGIVKQEAVKAEMDMPAVKLEVEHELAGVKSSLLSVRLPSFNRMSGVLQYANSVCLFINLFCSHYANAFFTPPARPNELHFTWYASPSHQPQSPVIQRILAAAAAQQSDGGAVQDALLLFCRRQGCPYRYYGRVAYVSWDEDARPMRFVFRLSEYEQLKAIAAAEASDTADTTAESVLLPQ